MCLWNENSSLIFIMEGKIGVPKTKQYYTHEVFLYKLLDSLKTK